MSVVYPVLPQSRGFCFVEFVSQYTACLASRDVPNRFFILVRFFEKTRIWFGMNLVQFGSKNVVRFGYYSYLLLV